MPPTIEIRFIGLAVCTVLLTTSFRIEAQIAMDTAADPAYDNGWQQGDNGGFGFSPWSVAASGILTSSSNNGDPPPSGNIDTAGRSWTLADRGPGDFGAVRGLNAALAVGQKFLVDLDIGSLAGDEVFRLEGSGFGERFSFGHLAGDSNYKIFTTSTDTGIPLTFDGLHLEFTLTGADTFSVAITPNGGSTATFSGSLSNPGDSIVGFILFGSNSLEDPSQDSFINSIAVVPEPSSYATITAILLIAGACWRRFRQRRLT